MLRRDPYRNAWLSGMSGTGAHLDDDVGHAVAHGRGGGRVALAHLLCQLHVRNLALVLVRVLRQALQCAEEWLWCNGNVMAG